MFSLKFLSLFIVLMPLFGVVVAGLGGRCVSDKLAHRVTIVGLLLTFLVSVWVAIRVLGLGESWHGIIYTWGVSGSFTFNVSFLVDALSAVMMVIVTFVAFLVHVYSVGYMAGDPGYKRFFSYVSLFTFSMLTLVLANNFLQLFFGWEAVGLVSYLLIGFWYHKPSAASGSLKAFLVNRVGDFGFIIGIAFILSIFGTLNYQAVFAAAPAISHSSIVLIPHTPWAPMTVICLFLFIGAMGKSAQVPLHVWLPESMEGPTPISALIHAATMVTAGIYMVARMSPLFNLSPAAMSVVMVIGATGALFLGFLAFVENDIKRVIAFSTMSQLGYMMAADGAGAYSAGLFHLMTHACFKALLFLAAGSIILALHHEQDMRKMGGLYKKLPWTYASFLIGTIALTALPPTAGFFSKDTVIEAVHMSHIPGATYAYGCLLLGAFVTAYYSFRALFMAFHGKTRLSTEDFSRVKETPWSMRFAMLCLSLPSLVLGYLAIGPMLYTPGWLRGVVKDGPMMDYLRREFHGAASMVMHGVMSLPFWFSLGGIIMAWVMCLLLPQILPWLSRLFSWLHILLLNRYGIDTFNDFVFVRGTIKLSQFFYYVTDKKCIDSALVDGTGKRVVWLAMLVRRLQSGYIYHYILAMLLGVLGFTIGVFFR